MKPSCAISLVAFALMLLLSPDFAASQSTAAHRMAVSSKAVLSSGSMETEPGEGKSP